ncbi:MAG: hypothetical protein AAF211_11285 [Myxococcota bacterium]
MPLYPAHPLLDDDEFDNLEPFAGARRRGRKSRRRRRRRGDRSERRRDPTTELVPLVPEAASNTWGPMTPVGAHLRLQAHRGFRGAVVELEPGLYLVAEVPNEALRPEFGAIPMLASLLTASAARALQRQPPTAAPSPSPWLPQLQLPWAPAPEPTSLLAGFGPRTCACGRRH